MPAKPQVSEAARPSTGVTDLSGADAAVDLSRVDADEAEASAAAATVDAAKPQGMAIDGLDEAKLKQEASAPVALDSSVEEMQAPSASDGCLQPSAGPISMLEPLRGVPEQGSAAGGVAASQDDGMPGDNGAAAETVRVTGVQLPQKRLRGGEQQCWHLQ